MSEVLSNEWQQVLVDSVTNSARIAYSAIAENAAAPHVLMRPRIFQDGNSWCALYGENIQDGVAGFGATPAEAAADFDWNWGAPEGGEPTGTGQGHWPQLGQPEASKQRKQE